jgi:hypothetical protein
MLFLFLIIIICRYQQQFRNIKLLSFGRVYNLSPAAMGGLPYAGCYSK